MVQILKINDFINESRGQRIGLRKTNKPFDPNNNQWTQARDTRKERAHEMTLKRDTERVHRLVSDFWDKSVELAKMNERLKEKEVGFYFNTTELCFKDPNWSSDENPDFLCRLYIAENNNNSNYTRFKAYLGGWYTGAIENTSKETLLSYISVVDPSDEEKNELPDGSTLIEINLPNEPQPFYYEPYTENGQTLQYIEDECSPFIVINYELVDDTEPISEGLEKLLEMNGVEWDYDENYQLLLMKIDMRNGFNKFTKALTSYLDRY